MVPFKEMPDVLRVIKDSVKLKPGSWVRLKRTIWKDDLAQVEHVDTAQNQVILKLIPRIDYNIKRGHLRDSGDAKDDASKKRKTRPAQRLFDFDSVAKIGGVPLREKENWIFENNRYTPKGFLIKNFPLSTVVSPISYSACLMSALGPLPGLLLSRLTTTLHCPSIGSEESVSK